MASTKHNVVTLTKYVGTLVLGGALTLAAMTTGTLETGETVIRTNVQIISSGGALPITATVTESDVVGNGTQSGIVIQNPYDEALLVRDVTLYVTTAGESTSVDVSRGTGSIATAGVLSGTTLADNLSLTAGLHNLSGSLLTPAAARQFILDANGGTNDYILIVSQSSEAFSGTTLKYHINGFPFE